MLIVTLPAALLACVSRLFEAMRAAEAIDPLLPYARRTFAVALPLNVMAPVETSAPVEVPLPLAIVFEALSAIVSVPTVPAPSTPPLVTVTLGVEATELVCTNFAPVPLTVIPLLPLIEPVPLSSTVPAVIEVAPL